MQKLRSINTYFWDDSYIAGLEPPYKLLFLYLLTNPLTNLAGCYEIQVRKIVFDTGLEDGMVRNGLERFERDRKVFYRDGWIYIRNFIKNQKLNTNMKKGVTAILDAAPEWIKETIRNPSKPFGMVALSMKGK